MSAKVLHRLNFPQRREIMGGTFGLKSTLMTSRISALVCHVRGCPQMANHLVPKPCNLEDQHADQVNEEEGAE